MAAGSVTINRPFAPEVQYPLLGPVIVVHVGEVPSWLVPCTSNVIPGITEK